MPAEEKNKSIFRRYIEEVFNQGNLELADEIFDRYVSHQPDGSTRTSVPDASTAPRRLHLGQRSRSSP